MLRSYLANKEIDKDKKEANLLPKMCRNNEDSSSSSSSSSSSGSSSDESADTDDANKTYASDFNIKRSENFDKSYSKMLTKKQNEKKPKSYTRSTKIATFCKRYKSFIRSPRVHFVNDAIFYVIFLMIFNYMILCEFNYFEHFEDSLSIDLNSSINLSATLEPDFVNKPLLVANISKIIEEEYLNLTTESLNFSDNSEKLNYRIKGPSKIEFMLIFWMITFVAEEARQVKLKFKFIFLRIL